MTVSKKEQEARNQKGRELIMTKLMMSISFNDWKNAANEIGIDKNQAENDDHMGNIMFAYKASKGTKSFTELADMGLGELVRIVFPEDLLPEEFKELEV